MITKRTGNGQTECFGCKQKGNFALNWNSFLYNYNGKPYCFNCLMEELEKLNEEKIELLDYLKERKEECKLIQKLYYIHGMARFAEDENLKKKIYEKILFKIEKSDK